MKPSCRSRKSSFCSCKSPSAPELVLLVCLLPAAYALTEPEFRVIFERMAHSKGCLAVRHVNAAAIRRFFCVGHQLTNGTEGPIFEQAAQYYYCVVGPLAKVVGRSIAEIEWDESLELMIKFSILACPWLKRGHFKSSTERERTAIAKTEQAARAQNAFEDMKDQRRYYSAMVEG